MSAAEAAARAERLVGVRFRPNGRDPAHGLDCAGLVGAAYGIAAEAGFAMRGGSIAVIADRLAAHGFVPARGAMRPGDVVVMRTGAVQFHLGVRTEGGMVHADARLRRVALLPGEVPWPVAGCWRQAGGSDGDAGADDGGERDRRPDRRRNRGTDRAAGGHATVRAAPQGAAAG